MYYFFVNDPVLGRGAYSMDVYFGELFSVINIVAKCRLVNS